MELGKPHYYVGTPSSILDRLQNAELKTTLPTVGVNVETVRYKNIKMYVWDLPGHAFYKPWWRNFYAHTDAGILVVDSNDVDRLEMVRDRLHQILEEEELLGIPLLILANKQDVPTAMSHEHIISKDGLDLVLSKDRPWTVLPCSVKEGTGISEGLDWLVSVLDTKT